MRVVSHLLVISWLAACQQTIDKTSLEAAISPEDAPERPSLRKMSDTLQNPQQLIDKYYDIFKTGNRNAASHLWTSYVLQRSSTMTDSTIQNVFKGFCAISGSPISNGDSAGRIYKVTLANVLGQNVTGVVRHCCWPCVCDMTDLVRVDTMTVQTSEGPKQYNMLVMGDPCDHPEQIDKTFKDPFDGAERKLVTAAPELACVSNGTKKVLKGAMYTDHGFPAIGFLFTDQQELNLWKPASELYDDWDASHVVSKDDVAWGWGQMCAARARQGYSSGMGLIFRVAAQISPVPKTVPKLVHSSEAAAQANGASQPQTNHDSATSSNMGDLKTSSGADSDKAGASLASQSRYPGLLSIGGWILLLGTCWIP